LCEALAPSLPSLRSSLREATSAASICLVGSGLFDVGDQLFAALGAVFRAFWPQWRLRTLLLGARIGALDRGKERVLCAGLAAIAILWAADPLGAQHRLNILQARGGARAPAAARHRR
jgi:hypothetical protein